MERQRSRVVVFLGRQPCSDLGEGEAGGGWTEEEKEDSFVSNLSSALRAK